MPIIFAASSDGAGEFRPGRGPREAASANPLSPNWPTDPRNPDEDVFVKAPCDAPPWSWRHTLVGACFAVLAVLATYNGRIDGPIDLYNEGERLAHIDTLLAGGLPFRDAYVPHGLGEDVLKPLAARWLFGDTLAAQRRLGQNAFIYRGLLPPLGAVGLILAVLVIMRRPLAAAIALGLLAFGLFEVTERQFVGLASVACLGVFLYSRRLRWLVVSGSWRLWRRSTALRWGCMPRPPDSHGCRVTRGS